MKKYRNRYSDEYWYEEVEEGVLAVRGGLDHWRFGAHPEGKIDMNRLAMCDPSGGPYLTIGDKVEGRTITNIRFEDATVFLEVK